MFTMKLHIDTTAQRVVFAEATKDAVDYLVSLLESPAVSFLGLDIWDSCVDNIFDSAEDLEDAADEPPPPVQVQVKKSFFQCSYKSRPACGEFVTETSGVMCPSCGWPMATEVSNGTPGAGCSAVGTGGFVAPRAAPMPMACVLTDDMRAMPMSGSRSTTLTRMRTLFLRDISAAAVEEKTVQLGHKECMAIAEAALRSRTVLTDVFLGNKAPQSSPPPSDA